MLSRLIVFLFLLTVFLIFLLPVKDTDFGWHYRCGREVLRGDYSCLRQNTYSYFLARYQWPSPRLLFDTSLALIYDRFGLIGVSVFGSLLLTFAFGLFLAAYPGSASLKSLALLATIIPAWSVYFLGYRSQITSLVFLAGEIFILEKARRDFRLLWFLIPLFIVWANTHPGFFLGPLVLGLFTMEKIASGNRRVIPVFVTALGATLINPYGFRVYEEMLRHFQVPMNTLIAEWVNPGQNQILGVIGSFLPTAIFIFRRKSEFSYRFLMLAVFAVLATAARRNLPLYYLALYAAVFGSTVATGLKENLLGLAEIISLPLLIAALIIALGKTPQSLKFDTDETTYCQEGQSKYPCRAISWFAGKRGNIFNTYEWGGFLIWKLPQTKVFVDGRMPAWQTVDGKSPYTVFLEILQAREGWNEALARYQTNYLFLAPGTFLDLALEKDQARKFGWEEQYRDETAVIYQR